MTLAGGGTVDSRTNGLVARCPAAKQIVCFGSIRLRTFPIDFQDPHPSRFARIEPTWNKGNQANTTIPNICKYDTRDKAILLIENIKDLKTQEHIDSHAYTDTEQQWLRTLIKKKTTTMAAPWWTRWLVMTRTRTYSRPTFVPT